MKSEYVLFKSSGHTSCRHVKVDEYEAWFTGGHMIEQQFFEYARGFSALPHELESYGQRPAETISVSTQHLAVIARETVSNGIGTIYFNDLYFVDRVAANGAGVTVRVNGVSGEWGLNCFMLPG